MADKEKLKALIGRLQKATGPDRKLDMDICVTLDTGRRVTGSGHWLGPDEFTASIETIDKTIEIIRAKLEG